MAKDASEDVSELFRRISQPELGYKSFDLALQDEEAPTVADVKKLARKREEAPVSKSAATTPSEAPAARGKLLRAWSPEPAPALEPVVKLVADNTETRTDLKAMFSAISKAKTPRSGR